MLKRPSILMHQSGRLQWLLQIRMLPGKYQTIFRKKWYKWELKFNYRHVLGYFLNEYYFLVQAQRLLKQT